MFRRRFSAPTRPGTGSTSARSATEGSPRAPSPGIWKHDSARIRWCNFIRPESRTRKRSSRELLQEDRQALQRRHHVHGLSGTARESRRRCRGDQHAGSLARDHRHPCVQAGKDVYLQKPASLTIPRRALSDAVHHSGRIFQIGSQQRPLRSSGTRRTSETANRPAEDGRSGSGRSLRRRRAGNVVPRT